MSSSSDKAKTEPCRVCGETSSAGWHCGTITCEACKKFFLRNSKSEYLEFKCIRSNMSCVITKSTRTNCAYCRFQKCIQVGMKQTEKSSNGTVPFKEIPCTVCADASSGLHFGAITCEGCKGFFRRNVKEGHKFLCTGNGKCEISYKSRNACRCCRFIRCVQVGMDLKNCKIGRQSNLFKQKIKTIMDNKADQAQSGNAENLDLSSSSNSFSSTNLSDMCLPSTNIQMDLKSNVDVEDLLEENDKFLVKKIYFSSKTLENIQNKIPTNKIINHDYELAFEFLKLHTESCVNFVSNTTKLEKFSASDQKIILIGSIHPLRLLQLIQLQLKREQQDNNSNFELNYFDCDTQTYEKISNQFPVFNEIKPHYKDLYEIIKDLKLDSKEFALYSAYLAFTTCCHGLSNLKQKFETNLELSETMSHYMFLRRNETESSDQLLNIAPWFERLNIKLQMKLYDKCSELIKMGVYLDKFYKTIFYSSFNFD